MKLSNETVAAFRIYLRAVSPGVLSFRNHYQKILELEKLEEAFAVRYTTDRADRPVLDIKAGDEKATAANYIFRSYVPKREYLAQMEPHLFNRVVAAVASDFPKFDEASGVADMISQSAWQYTLTTTSSYFALLVHLGVERKEQAFDICIDQLDEQLDPKRSVYYYSAYLYNFEIDLPETTFVELPQNTQIRLTTLGDATREAHIQNEHHLAMRRLLPPDYIITLRQDLGKVGCFRPAVVQKVKPLDDVICALRLNGAGYVGRDSINAWHTGLPPSTFTDFRIPDATAESLSSPLFQIFDFEAPKTKYRLNKDCIVKVRETLNDLQATFATDKLGVALSRFNSSYSRKDQKERIVDLVIALENLFGEETVGQSTEVGYRLRMRAARYLGNTPDERLQIMNFLSQSYSLRSKIVHGTSSDVARLTKKLSQSVDEFASEIEELVRRAIRELLHNPSHIGQDYQNRLLLSCEALTDVP